jgi:hypothetical protein
MVRKALVATLIAGLAGIGLVAGSTAEASASPSCSTINIGQPGNVYGRNGEYAGQVEQEYNSCNSEVYAHFEWSGAYTAKYAGDDIRLDVSSPNGYYYLSVLYGEDTKDPLSGGVPVHDATPDNWRAGAQWNQNGCVAWGTLHAYAGYDVDGPTATCGSWVAPN